LKRCTSTEHLWKRKLVSLTSTEHWEIFLPRSERSWRADVLLRLFIIIIIIGCSFLLYTLLFIAVYILLSIPYWGTGIRGLMRGMATLPQGNQGLLVVKDKVGRPPGELGVRKSMECDIFPFSALTLLVG